MPRYLNKPDMCIVCFMKPQDGYGNKLIKHHVSYDPEVIAWVHFHCHQKIHDPDKPIKFLIQYTRKDSINYYAAKKKAREVKPNV